MPVNDELGTRMKMFYEQVPKYLTYPSLTDRYLDIREELIRYEKLEIEIKQLSGFNLDCLKRLFAMGYTLQAPDYGQSLLAEEGE